MADTSDGVLKRLGVWLRETAAIASFAGVFLAAWLVIQSLVAPRPGEPWQWVAYAGWALGFLGIWIALAPRLKAVRPAAVVMLPAASVVGVTLLGAFSSLAELVGPLLFGLGVVGAGILALRLVETRARDAEAQGRHDELIGVLRSIEERLARLEQPAAPPAPPAGLISRLLARWG